MFACQRHENKRRWSDNRNFRTISICTTRRSLKNKASLLARHHKWYSYLPREGHAKNCLVPLETCNLSRERHCIIINYRYSSCCMLLSNLKSLTWAIRPFTYLIMPTAQWWALTVNKSLPIHLIFNHLDDLKPWLASFLSVLHWSLRCVLGLPLLLFPAVFQHRACLFISVINWFYEGVSYPSPFSSYFTNGFLL